MGFKQFHGKKERRNDPRMIPFARHSSVVWGVESRECSLLVRCGILSRIVGPGREVEVYKGAHMKPLQTAERG